MILTMTPYALDRNLGRAYNEAMALLPSRDDWAIFLDHDAMNTTRDWYRLIAEAIAFRPDAGAFVAVTNRIDAVWQRATETDPENHDIGYHTAAGLARLSRRTLLDITDTKGFGGVCFAVSKAAWRAAGAELAGEAGEFIHTQTRVRLQPCFDPLAPADWPTHAAYVPPGGWTRGGFADGLLCVDHSIHFGLQRAGRRIYLLESLYVYHRRRAFIGPLPFDTPRAKACPCRGREPMPTVRLELPAVEPVQRCGC